MALFADVLSKYQQTRILNRIESGEEVGKVFADYIEFFGNMPLSLCFVAMKEEYEAENKSMVNFACDFLNQIDENIDFGVMKNEKV